MHLNAPYQQFDESLVFPDIQEVLGDNLDSFFSQISIGCLFERLLNSHELILEHQRAHYLFESFK